MAPAHDPLAPRALGPTGLAVSPICVGTSPLASMPKLYGYPVSEERAEATVEAVLDGPLNFLDTPNSYGGGNAERRIGAVLRRRGGLPAGVVLATKVDADPATGDFSGERARRSVAESLERLGLDKVQLRYLHDPEFHLSFEQAMAPGGPVEALLALRDEGVLGHIGVAGGPVWLLRQFVATGAFEVVLSHNRYTLLDRSAEPLIADAVPLPADARSGHVSTTPSVLTVSVVERNAQAWASAGHELAWARSDVEAASASRAAPVRSTALRSLARLRRRSQRELVRRRLWPRGDAPSFDRRRASVPFRSTDRRARPRRTRLWSTPRLLADRVRPARLEMAGSLSSR